MPGKIYPVMHSDAEWRQIMTPEQYEVMRGHGTEMPGSCALLFEKRPGRFSCAACGQPLFETKGKFESGTGWPSFNDPIDGAVETSVDRSLGMVRTEVHCANCGSHLGHVFDDGPAPTHLRYCINGIAMTFEPDAGRQANPPLRDRPRWGAGGNRELVSRRIGAALMSEAKSGNPVEFLDLLLEYFADGARWAQGDLDDGHGGRCLVGAIHHLRCRHQIPSGAAESLLQEALPPGYCHLAVFNDHCANIAQLRALIVNARTLAIATSSPPPQRIVAEQHWSWRALIRLKRERATRAAAGDARQTSSRPPAPERLAA